MKESRSGYIVCQICKKIIAAQDARAGKVDDPLGGDTKHHAWFCETCATEEKRLTELRE